MASITIRNLDEALKRSLKIRAAEHGRSMEEEARDILRQSISCPAPARPSIAASLCSAGLIWTCRRERPRRHRRTSIEARA